MRKRALLLTLLLPAVATACQDRQLLLPPEPPSATPSPSRHLTEAQRLALLQGLPLGIDDDYVELAMRIPGYGGHSWQDGRLVVYLKNLSQAAHAKNLILDALGAAGSEVEFRQGKYDFIELTRWRHRLAPVWKIRDVLLMDTDEAENRLMIGIDPRRYEGTAALVRAEVVRLGVPVDAVTFTSSEVCPIDPPSDDCYIAPPEEPDPSLQPADLTIRDRNPTVQGGLEIQWSIPFVQTQPGVCTLGAYAVDSLGRTYFVTASHCSGRMGEQDSNSLVWYQGGIKDENRIGYGEAEDPRPYFGAHPTLSGYSSCPSGVGMGCRWTDMTVIRDNAPRPVASARIARPYPNSITIDRAVPQFTVGSSFGGRRRGNGNTTLHMVGRSSGWVSGKDSHHCFDYRENHPSTGGRDLLLLCQTGSTIILKGGDSGAPIFSAQPSLSVNFPVQLEGIASGNFSVNGVVYSAFSPMINISHEPYAPLLNDLRFGDNGVK